MYACIIYQMWYLSIGWGDKIKTWSVWSRGSSVSANISGSPFYNGVVNSTHNPDTDNYKGFNSSYHQIKP